MSVVPVGEEGDLVSRHVERSSGILLWLVPRSPGRRGRGCQEACPFAGIIQIKFAGISQINRPALVVLKLLIAEVVAQSIEAVEHPDAFFLNVTLILGNNCEGSHGSLFMCCHIVPKGEDIVFNKVGQGKRQIILSN
ncbi:hypothetical protein SNK04_001958 [Fusarium graminearum]